MLKFPKPDAAKTCLQCGKPLPRLKPSHEAKRRGFCSPACGNRSRALKPQTCSVCGKEWINKTKGKTCSAPCGYELRKRRLRHPKRCASCSKQFWPTRQHRTGWEKYCSRACLNQSHAVRRLVDNCRNCGARIERPASAAAWSRKLGNRYCSHSCHHVHMRGANSPHYRGAQDPNRGSGWARLAASIRVRDDHTCQRCGVVHQPKTKAFPVDHIIPWRAFEDKDKAKANDPTNLTTLCMRCHAIKTTVMEKRWLRGDRIGMEQYRKALQLKPLFAAGQ